MQFAKLIPELCCSDIQRSLRFYVGTLGFSVLYERPGERFAFLDRSGAQIMPEQSVGRVLLAGELDYPFGRGMNLQIEIADVEVLYAKVLASGSAVHLALEDKWYRCDDVLLGNRQFVVGDPDGYLLRFFQDLGSKSG